MTPDATTVPAPWFVRPPSAEHAARVFCFPFSGAGASVFSGWPAVIDDVEVCPVQPPGRENRLGHAHYGTYENLAAQLVDPLAPLLDRPFAVFGHCAGALSAFETVVRLAELGLPTPECLVVSGQPAPHHASRDRMLDMTETELRAEVESFVRGRGLDPRPDMVDMGLAVLLRDHAAAGAYRRSEPVALPCPVVVVHWRADPDVRVEDLGGWRRYSDSVAVRQIDGGHYDFMSAPADLRRLVTGWRRKDVA